ncbi:MAG: HlyC/CorC family transporter [Alphaproteobacteria bacterium]
MNEVAEVTGVDWGFWLSVGAIVFLLMLSAFFSGSETALTAVSRPRMHHLARKGDKRAAVVRRLSERQEDLLGALLLGNNLVNILAASIATSVLIRLFGEAGVAYATLGMTFLVLVFAEVLPKTFAINHPDRAALTVAPVVRFVVGLLSPFSKGVQWIVGKVLSAIGERPSLESRREEMEEEREEALLGAIELHHGDAETQSERQMLKSILELADLEVSEVMTHRRNVVMVDVGRSSEEIVAEVLESPYTRIPLWRDAQENIVGVLHAKALLRAVRAAGGEAASLDIAAVAASPWFVPDSTTLLDQLQAFRRRREHFALIVDEYGAFMGVCTLEDILEEIVGDIVDEHDVPLPGVRRQPDGSDVAPGRTPIRDLNREFDWDLPDDDATTLAGLIMHEARLLPEAGQTFEFHGYRFRILRRTRNQIAQIRVTPPQRRHVDASAETDAEE